MSNTLRNILTTFRKMKSLPEKNAESYGYLAFLIANLASFDQARREYFTEEKSRQIFDWRMQNNLLRSLYGHNPPEILDNIPYTKEEWDALVQKAERMEPVIREDYELDRIHTWILEGYSLKGLCEVEAGDVVLDCGTYTGNTSVYFSQKAGQPGHVYGFEPGPSIFWVYNKNMEPYGNVTPVNAGLTDKSMLADSATTMAFMENMGAGCKLAAGGGVQVPVTAIDVFCAEQKVTRVDFIKMDIEGAEADALKGAAETIRAHRPKMAISAYHKAEDLFELPQLIASICPGYTFFLRHFSDGNFETVLFCCPGGDGRPARVVEAKEDPAVTEALYKAVLSLLASSLMDESALVQAEKEQSALARLMAEQSAVKMRDAAGQIVTLAQENEQLAQENIALRRIVEKSKKAVMQ